MQLRMAVNTDRVIHSAPIKVYSPEAWHATSPAEPINDGFGRTRNAIHDRRRFMTAAFAAG